MMEQNRQNDPIKSPEIQEMILNNRIGQISAELAKRLNIARKSFGAILCQPNLCGFT